MLASLTIKNVVLIDHLTIEFRSGLCALTGETGAGKSILLDSLGLALGARSDAGLVRKGADQAVVTATFDFSANHPIFSFLREQGLELERSLILRRSVSKEGGSKAFINEQPVSISLLKQAGEMLVEIHGQFDTQSLLNPKMHGLMLDDYAGHRSLLKAVKEAWNNWKESEKKLSEKRAVMDKARRDEEFYRTALEDLDALLPKESEEEGLSKLRDRLMRRDKILANLNLAKSGLQEMESASGGVWRALEAIGDEAKGAVIAMDGVSAEIQEVVTALQNLSADLDNSEYSLEEIDDRLFALKAQARKHECEIDELLQKREEIARALNAIEDDDKSLSDLMRQVETYKKEYEKKAFNLSASRKKAALKLASLVMGELPPLKLDKARFEVSVEEMPEEQWNAQGMNDISFLVATNPGTEAGALNKIASGGEMARFMLALKVVLSEVGTASALVFDEVDSGVGGATAAAVGERLARLAKKKQILVVTHSPQVAAIAPNHWIVSKGGEKTLKTNITPLFDSHERREEIARMLAGEKITEEARAAAEKLIEASAV